jgi:hypothetical protein
MLLQGNLIHRDSAEGFNGEALKEATLGIKGLPAEPAPGFGRCVEHMLFFAIEDGGMTFRQLVAGS